MKQPPIEVPRGQVPGFPAHWLHWDTPGHFCSADKCRFVRHTDVGPVNTVDPTLNRYCVSTVGEWFPYGDAGPMDSIGGNGRLYETYVFDLQSADHRWTEIDRQSYMDAASAEAGHFELCRKWDEDQGPQIVEAGE